MEELCTHAMVPQVTIESVDEATVSFWTRSGSKTGDPNERLRRLFTVPLSELWTAPIQGRPVAVELKAGATGPLYLSRAGWDTTTADGFQIFGAANAVFKEPLCLGAEVFHDHLTVIPSKLLVHGFVEGEAEPIQIDLLGPQAAEAQDVRWNGAEYIEIQLTEDGNGRSAGTVKVWPTQFVVHGCAAAAPTSAGQVDLLDAELAGHEQRIQFDKRGTTISLVLTQDGFGAFHVIPGM
jgi:hypothetical protein